MPEKTDAEKNVELHAKLAILVAENERQAGEIAGLKHCLSLILPTKGRA